MAVARSPARLNAEINKGIRTGTSAFALFIRDPLEKSAPLAFCADIIFWVSSTIIGINRKAIVIITSDHGSIRITNPVRIKGDRETSVNLRYKVGRNLEFNPKEVFSIRNPGEIFLPKVNITSSFVFCRQNDFFVYPNNFNQYVAYYRNTIQHGGISLEEMLVPYAVLQPK